MHLCTQCFTLGYCRKATTPLVSEKRLESPDFLIDLRAFTASLNISPDHWLDFLVDTYRDYRGRIVHRGQEVFLDLNELESKSIKTWFRDFTNKPVADGVRPRLREESRARIRILTTILATRFPHEVSMLGVRAANDNSPPKSVDAS